MKFNRREWNVIYEAVKDYKRTIEGARCNARERYEECTYDSLINTTHNILKKLETEDI